MGTVASSGLNEVAELKETLLDSSVKEDAMGKGGRSIDVPVSALSFLGLGGNDSDSFEFLGITEEDVENLVHFIEEARKEAMNEAPEVVNGGHPFAQFPWVEKSVDSLGLTMMDVSSGFALVDYLKEANRKFMEKQKLCSIPKKQRSNRAKPPKITNDSGFLSKFGAPVETRFSDAEPVEPRRSKSQKRLRESEESEEETLNKPKRQKGRKIQNNRVKAQLAKRGLLPPPNMPTEFKNLIEGMGGSEEKLLIQKIIFKTDLSKSHNRLQIPEKQVMVEFLTEDEKRKLDEKGLNVELIEPCLKKSTIHLTKWNMNNSRVFVFNEQWNSVVDGNQSTLKKNAVVQIWSFRTAPKSMLCFAMVKVKDGDDY